MGIGHRKRRCNPAKSIDDMYWNSIDYALDRIANKLGCRDNHTTRQKNCRCKQIVQSEDSIVGFNLLNFEIVLQATQETIHLG